MANLFEHHQKKQALKDKLYFYGFYTVLLYLLALTIVLISKDTQTCLFDWYCVSSKQHALQAAFILYVYLLVMVILVIQTYKLLEKLVAKKNHLRYFKYIFYAMPFVVALVVWLAGTSSYDAYLIIIFAAIMSLLGLLMIEFRKRPDSHKR